MIKRGIPMQPPPFRSRPVEPRIGQIKIPPKEVTKDYPKMVTPPMSTPEPEVKIPPKEEIKIPPRMAKGGSVGSASKRADGCAQRGKTKGKMY